MALSAVFVLLLAGHAAALEMRVSYAANPLRKVVTMLQMLQNIVTEEYKKKVAPF